MAASCLSPHFKSQPNIGYFETHAEGISGYNNSSVEIFLQTKNLHRFTVVWLTHSYLHATKCHCIVCKRSTVKRFNVFFIQFAQELIVHNNTIAF